VSPRLRQIDEILLHGGENAVAISLRGGQNHHSRPWLGRRGIGEQNHLVGRKSELGAGEQVGHGLRIVDRAVQILKAPSSQRP
jgi:hypothetical protein